VNYLLDANAVIAMIEGRGSVEQEVRRHRANEFGLPVIVAHELYRGAFGSSRRMENLARVEALPFPAVDFDRGDARAAGRIRVHLEQAGTPIGPYDILIAGQAMARDLTLVTHNTREFQRVPGLRIVDWM
jgi:tRNA(fMet)-specific endonuclease VapC